MFKLSVNFLLKVNYGLVFLVVIVLFSMKKKVDKSVSLGLAKQTDLAWLDGQIWPG
jgi:hypothetical protein